MLKYRRPTAILIDEAQHFAKVTKGSRLFDQLDHLKSLAVTTQTVFVLAGTYDLPVFRSLNSQLSRRSIDVHFPRYNAANEDGQQAFQRVLLSFQRHLPLEEPPDLVHQWTGFYARTAGCIGILKDWLTKALAEALANDEKTLSSALLKRYAPSADRCDQTITEIEEGEKLLTSAPETDERLLHRLGLGGRRSTHPKNELQQSHGTEPLPPQSRKIRVGQRNPDRDPVRKEAKTDE